MVKRYSVASFCQATWFKYQFAQSKRESYVEVFKGNICWAKHEIPRA